MIFVYRKYNQFWSSWKNDPKQHNLSYRPLSNFVSESRKQYKFNIENNNYFSLYWKHLESKIKTGIL